MSEKISIPVGKVRRAGQFLKTGVKVSKNYVRYFALKAITGEADEDQLHRDNAIEVVESLGELKGSALKAAQMISLDRYLLPRAYSDILSLSQYNVPPLSYPLIVNTFRKAFGKSPDEVFDDFSHEAIHAASIGQVHMATLNGKKLAVKIQYPGIADSIDADLAMIKPLVMHLFNINSQQCNHYLQEIRERMLEETNYVLELERSILLTDKCRSHLENVIFPVYYPELSSSRIITMDWLDGIHLKEFLALDPPQTLRNKTGQSLWDFVNFQIHHLRKVHADPHPGNFLFRDDEKVGIIDFGCVKEIPEKVYQNYFRLFDSRVLDQREEFTRLLYENEFLYPSDSDDDKEAIIQVLRHLLPVLVKPFSSEFFDFGDENYFDQVYGNINEVYNNPTIRRLGIARGSRHLIYITRTYLGLYTLLHDLKAVVKTARFNPLPV